MAIYKFIVAGGGKGTREVRIEADGEREARQKIRGRDLIPVRCCGEVSPGNEGGSRRLSFRRSRVSTFDFTRQLAPLLDAGIPLERALAIIAESSAAPEQRDFVNALRQGLHEGKKFSELVRSHGSLFPRYYANLIESGEESGCLGEVVGELCKFMGESRELRDFILSSSIYPAGILSITLIVTVVLFTVFVPRVTRIFLDMGRELPPAMLFLDGAGTALVWGLAILVIGGVGGWFLLKSRLGEERLRRERSRLLLRLPLFGRVIVDLQMCKYIRTLAILLANHVEIVRTVRIAGRVITDPVIAAEFAGVDRRLKEGAKLSGALAGRRFMPAELIPMLRVGEESGTVGEMLARIAGNLENATRLRIKRLLSLFEPAVIVFLALLVLVVVVSVFVAMMEINAINQGG